MDSGLSTIRNLLYIVLVLALLSILANIYVGTQLSQNSDELASFGRLLKAQMEQNVVGQSEQLQKKMEALNQQADGIDAKLQNAQDSFVARMNKDLPPLINRSMDSYIKTRTPMIEKEVEREVMKQVPQVPH
jgi:ABC-type transport system involved in cytochrome bd biosynthesis fused ATPase/permease subunit